MMKIIYFSVTFDMETRFTAHHFKACLAKELAIHAETLKYGQKRKVSSCLLEYF